MRTFNYYYSLHQRSRWHPLIGGPSWQQKKASTQLQRLPLCNLLWIIIQWLEFRKYRKPSGRTSCWLTSIVELCSFCSRTTKTPNYAIGLHTSCAETVHFWVESLTWAILKQTGLDRTAQWKRGFRAFLIDKWMGSTELHVYFVPSNLPLSEQLLR